MPRHSNSRMSTAPDGNQREHSIDKIAHNTNHILECIFNGNDSLPAKDIEVNRSGKNEHTFCTVILKTVICENKG